VLTSPLQRAAETCLLAELDVAAIERGELREWDYGHYEGLTTIDIRLERPGWTVSRDGVPGGETLAEVGRRVDRVIEEVHSIEGDVALFAHDHLLRILAARWLGLDPAAGRLFALDPGTISILGYERETAVMRSWNHKPA